MTTDFAIAIDCHDPELLTRFWCTALGYQPKEPPDGFADWLTYFRHIGVSEEELQGFTNVYLVDPEGRRPQFFFQEVPEEKVVKNRIHLDVLVGGGREYPIEVRRQRVNAEAQRLVAAGGTIVHADEHGGVDHYSVLMRDPEGNEFCVV